MSKPVTCQKQAQRFLAILDAMNPDSKQAFQKIYMLAPKTGQARSSILVGHHVRVAMIEALAHPQLAYWVKMNLAIRVSRKLAQTTGNIDKAHRLTELLEEFHIAVEAFIHKIPIEQAIVRRTRPEQRGAILSFPLPWQLSGNFISDEDISQIQRFKQHLIPGFIRAIRNSSSIESREGVGYTQVQ
jgi:hypothetical protein